MGAFKLGLSKILSLVCQWTFLTHVGLSGWWREF